MAEPFDYAKRMQEIIENRVKPQLGTQGLTPVDFGERFRAGLGVEERMQPIVARESALRSELFGLGPKLRTELPERLDPRARERIIAERKAPIREELSTTGQLREYQYGKITDVIERQTSQYVAKMQKQKDEYDKSRDELQDLMDLRQFAQSRKQFEETQARGKYEFEEEMKLARAREARLGEETTEPTGYESLGEQYLRGELTDEQLKEFTPTAATEIRRNAELIKTGIIQQRETTGVELTDAQIRTKIDEWAKASQTDKTITPEFVKKQIELEPGIKNIDRALLILGEMEDRFKKKKFLGIF